jgi:hypothetical protein
MESGLVRFGRWLGAVAFLLAGPVSGFFLFRLFREAQASDRWPSVPGRVLRASVGTTAIGRYFPDVSYSYRVNGREYLGTRVRASDGESNIRDAAEQTIHDLAPGMRKRVYYDPDDPARSVLRTGAGYQEYGLLLVPVLITTVGIRSVWRLVRTAA